MPFKSEAQRRKFYAMAERGEMPRSKVEEYERATKGSIPERVGRGDTEQQRVKAARSKFEMKRRAKKRAARKLNQSKSEAAQAS